jgi:hypothetical protein
MKAGWKLLSPRSTAAPPPTAFVGPIPKGLMRNFVARITHRMFYRGIPNPIRGAERS